MLQLSSRMNQREWLLHAGVRRKYVITLAALYHKRSEAENAFDELKTHLKGSRRILRSKAPDLVRQEFYGLILAHFAIRGLMHKAALERKKDPDELSFTHAEVEFSIV